jgi:hypothetical protein
MYVLFFLFVCGCVRMHVCGCGCVHMQLSEVYVKTCPKTSCTVTSVDIIFYILIDC